MVAWLNFLVLLLSSFLAVYYYVKSVSPARLEEQIGEISYRRCGRYRIVSCLFMIVIVANYILYYFFPLPVRLPRHFPWCRYISFAIAAIIAVPSGYLIWCGIRDGGKESMTPQKDRGLHGGIYLYIRHPQALGELPLWFAIALLLDCPFLVLWSLVYIPLWVYICVAEEKDLLIRYGRAYEDYRKRTGFWFPRSLRKDRSCH